MRDIAADANAVGLVSGRELAAGQVAIRSMGSRGSVRSVTVGNRVVGYAKWTGDTAATSRERQMLTGLAPHGLAPRVLTSARRTGAAATTVAGDEDAEVLWTAAQPGRILSSLGTRPYGACELAELAQAWGMTLARLHTASAGVAVVAERPWVLTLPTRVPFAGARRPGRAQLAVLRLAGSEPGLMYAARQAADRWSEGSLVHTDLAARHVLVETGGQTGATRVRFVDFARAGRGDADWDLAGALETLTVLALSCGVTDTVPNDYFLRGYRRSGGPGHVDSRLRGLRALEIAWRLAESDESGSASLDRWLGRARALAGGARPLGRAA